MSYEKINKIKKETQCVAFSMAVTYLLDKGYNFCKELTDEDINSLAANGMMTKEFVQELVRTARDIALVEDSPIEIIQYCAAEDVFDLRRYCDKLPRTELIKVISTLTGAANISLEGETSSYWLGLEDEEEGDLLKDEIVQCGF